jgi:hypothetical protein
MARDRGRCAASGGPRAPARRIPSPVLGNTAHQPSITARKQLHGVAPVIRLSSTASASSRLARELRQRALRRSSVPSGGRASSLSSRLLRRRRRRGRRAAGSAPSPRPRDRGQRSRPPLSSELEASASASARAQLERHGCRRRAVEHWGASPRTAPHPHASGPPEELCRHAAPRAPPSEHDRGAQGPYSGPCGPCSFPAAARPWRSTGSPPEHKEEVARTTGSTCTAAPPPPPRRSTRSRGGRRTRSREGKLMGRHGSWGGREWGGRERGTGGQGVDEADRWDPRLVC